MFLAFQLQKRRFWLVGGDRALPYRAGVFSMAIALLSRRTRNASRHSTPCVFFPLEII
jgi:hypothetical protein